MKAVVCRQYGEPEVLEIQELPLPQVKAKEVLIRIKASAVNSGDVRVRGLAVGGIMKLIMRLVLGLFKPRKPVLGTVYAGVVEALGEGASRFKVGDKVFGMTGFKFGTHAEYLSVSESSPITWMPQNASFEEAAALIFGGQTAIYFLESFRLADKKGAKILIIGGTGAVGSLAIQLARYWGAEVTAVCSSQGQALVHELGISQTILYDQEDYSQSQVRYDFIFDALGQSQAKICKSLLKPGGHYKTVGGLDYASESLAQLELLKTLFEQGHIRAIIDRVYPLEEVIEAHRYVDSGRKKGNVILSLA